MPLMPDKILILTGITVVIKSSTVKSTFNQQYWISTESWSFVKTKIFCIISDLTWVKIKGYKCL